jgi:N-acyl-D-amino-acid deacylase
MFDRMIRGGTVVDGSGRPSFTGDVGIRDGVITDVSTTPLGAAKEEINAEGLLVTPGFVDMHTHYDAQATWDPYLTPSSLHGCTTVVMGNCGVGFAPAAPDKHAWLINLMEGVEDIPGAAMHEGIQWGWESFPEYLDALDRDPKVMDIAAQIPHGALRGYVMGDRGADNEDATETDIAEMSDLVAEALRAGAMGFSTSRTLLHKSASGVPVPGTFAAYDELMGIARSIASCDHGVFQLATDHLNVPKELKWMEDVSALTGRPVLFNYSQVDDDPTLWIRVRDQLDEIAQRGRSVFGQVAGRAIGVLMCWQGTAHPFALCPSFLSMMHTPWAEKYARLKDPEFRQKLLTETPVHVGDFETFVTQTFNKMFYFRREGDYEPNPTESLAAQAMSQGVDPKVLAYDALMENEGTGFLYFPLFNYASGHLDHLYELHQHPRTLMGLSDGGAHCGAICDGGMPTFMLSHWTRDRKRGPTLPLEHMIRRQTRDTAFIYGLTDRGLLAPGYRADLNLIDYASLNGQRPRMVFDLPAGGRRLMQGAEGYVMTLCGGVVTHRGGQATGALPGGLIRGPQRAMSSLT